ncbi:hypothetical protein CCR75_006530 [Bremia lactucae]|uniref:WW domain-containing protein n=1 Tax=Bremia lactucae TaxID=4779 RepID=A0A976FP35_BRELC|nr:hypothetical protein CCR75_006530 [Bremia lactucae]
MAALGVNGASSGTLNARFIRCDGCRVNVPKEDMIALRKCTVCGRSYEPAVGANEIATVAFDGAGAAVVDKSVKRKRWAMLTSKRGRRYYHNTETGEDRWDKPADVEADAIEDTFVPFKNDAVKKAVLREQMKIEATKLGVPLEVVAALQQHQNETDDPLAQMVGLGSKSKRNSSLADDASGSKDEYMPLQEDCFEQEAATQQITQEAATQQITQEAANDGGKCVLM